MLFEIGLGYFENALAMLRLRLCYFKKAQAQAQAHVISRILGLSYLQVMLKISKSSYSTYWTKTAEFFSVKGITFFGVNFEPFMDYIITIQLIGHNFLNPNL